MPEPVGGGIEPTEYTDGGQAQGARVARGSPLGGLMDLGDPFNDVRVPHDGFGIGCSWYNEAFTAYP